MTNGADQHLRTLLARYAVDPTRPRVIAQQIYPTLSAWGGLYLREVRYSGSFAKGTGNSCSTDLDLFISLSPQRPGTLRDIYRDLCLSAQHWGWQPRRQDVSIGVSVGGLQIDLVPGRLQPNQEHYHWLYHRRGDTWSQTNVQLHIDTVVQSSRVEEIRLVKLWRHRASLDFPSFYLELCVIEALKGCQYGNLASNFARALAWLRDQLTLRRIMDPANTNNCVSDELTLAEKRTIGVAAGVALRKPYYQDFIW